MRLLINHLTRMGPGHICVAGVDQATGRHVRPQATTRWEYRHLAALGGPFDIGALVELSGIRPTPTPPETEDVHIEGAKAVGGVTAEDFWASLEKAAKPNLAEIFGPELLPRGPRALAVDVKKGTASLGVLRPGKGLNLHVRKGVAGEAQVRLLLREGERENNLGVTDIRLHGPDHLHPDEDAVARAAKAILEGAEVLLSVGLTRSYSSGGFPPVHWLQVNNIHFKKRPLWTLAKGK